MAGIYIPGMEMPTSCKDCRISFDVGQEWLCQLCTDPNPCVVGGEFWRECGDGADEVCPDWCPLIPVPPHGRLIDADAYRAEMKKRQDACAEWRDDIKDGGGYGTELYYRADSFLGAMCEAKLTLDKMPTIIPGEESQE